MVARAQGMLGLYVRLFQLELWWGGSGQRTEQKDEWAVGLGGEGVVTVAGRWDEKARKGSPQKAAVNGDRKRMRRKEAVSKEGARTVELAVQARSKQSRRSCRNPKESWTAWKPV